MTERNLGVVNTQETITQKWRVGITVFEMFLRTWWSQPSGYLLAEGATVTHAELNEILTLCEGVPLLSFDLDFQIVLRVEARLYVKVVGLLVFKSKSALWLKLAMDQLINRYTFFFYFL